MGRSARGSSRRLICFDVPSRFGHDDSQSHEPEFDYLKSLEIEEKINRIKWCKRQNSAHFLLSTNGASPRFRLLSSSLPNLSDNPIMEFELGRSSHPRARDDATRARSVPLRARNSC